MYKRIKEKKCYQKVGKDRIVLVLVYKFQNCN